MTPKNSDPCRHGNSNCPVCEYESMREPVAEPQSSALILGWVDSYPSLTVRTVTKPIRKERLPSSPSIDAPTDKIKQILKDDGWHISDGVDSCSGWDEEGMADSIMRMDEALRGRSIDVAPNVQEVLSGLSYIADSPSEERGGFHPNAVEIAKKAIALIEYMTGERSR